MSWKSSNIRVLFCTVQKKEHPTIVNDMLSLKKTKGSTSPLLWIYLNSVLKKTRKNALTLALKRKKKKSKTHTRCFFHKTRFIQSNICCISHRWSNVWSYNSVHNIHNQIRLFLCKVKFEFSFPLFITLC